MTTNQKVIFLEALNLLKDYNESLVKESPELLKQLSDSKLRMLTYNVNRLCLNRAEDVKQYLIDDGANIIGLQEVSKELKTWKINPSWKMIVSSYCALILTNPKLWLVSKSKLFGGCLIKAIIRYDEQFTFTAICVYAPSNDKNNLRFWKKARSLKAEGIVILFGDVNTVADPRFDVFGGKKVPHLGATAFALVLQKLKLQDLLLPVLTLSTT
ncbi:hypothetical protein DSO57_1032108 [Entomophthora muscae]|uniref:Uncharacterized protein n=1 Tax=Entomophthora muscae TaxID=34485 RepID=A0ACC2TYD0_9FUNG|nr:hypothetical protein DSO57_1032108 [Entomophthora muscae]